MQDIFRHPSLVWGLAIAGIPILIHLINMLRHRRVEWAAMEFLLVSQKKHRIWVLFKQLLLLLLRMAAIAAIVSMLAGPRLHNQLGGLLGTTRTHHIILLDDSFSMSDSWEEKNAFDEAKRAIKQIGDVAARQRQPQSFTLLRFSRVGQSDGATEADMIEKPVNWSKFPQELKESLDDMEVSQADVGPLGALEAIGQLMGETDDERRIVYVISDFRTQQWDNPTELEKQLLELNAAEAEVHLVNCVDKARSNLAITSLEPAAGIQAADVTMRMDVKVRNFGSTTANDVSVTLEEDGETKPGVTIPRIPAGAEVSGRFEVRFSTGQHRVVARLVEDAIAVDNSHSMTIDLPPAVPVLIVDGSPQAMGARYLNLLFTPGSTAETQTGLSPQVESPRFLSREALEPFGVVNLVNIERFDDSAVRALEEYVKNGGGVAIFLGELSRSRYVNDSLYRNGEGLFPLPIGEPEDLTVYMLDRSPDMKVQPHPIFRTYAGAASAFLKTVIVSRYFSVPDTWKLEPDSTTRVIAWLRNGAPLAVEKQYGKGRVIAFLTTAAPVWNNWVRERQSQFPRVAFELQAYLSQREGREVSTRVGLPLELAFDPSVYTDKVSFFAPEDYRLPAATLEAALQDDGTHSATFHQTNTSGLYRAELTPKQGNKPQQRYFAVNVGSQESDLTAISGPQLASRLQGVDYKYAQTSNFRYTISEMAGYDLTDALLCLLILLLIGEQLLAYSCSSHPPARPATAKGGAR